MIPVVAVTVLEDRAAITRRGTIAVAAGQQRIVIERVAPVLADKTLTSACAGARVLDVRCERYLAPWKAGGDAAIAALRGERDRLADAAELAQTRAAAAAVEAEAVADVIAAALADLAASAARGITADAGDSLAALEADEAAARARHATASLDAAELAQQLARLDARIAKATHDSGEQAARLVVDVVAEAASEATLTIGYVTPGAAWRPMHRATLARETGRIAWETQACVWQATGEDWRDAALTFSLERASLGVDPPALADDELHTRRRPDTITVEARDQEHQTTGLGGDGGGPREVPGIDDGGLGLVLTAAKATVRCDGAPHRVPIGGFAGPVQLSLVAVPLRSAWVHLRARIVNAGATPLLAGPVDLVMASGYVGRAEVGFVAAGEKFHLGFGPESELRVHRSETRERDDAGLLGGWNVQTVRVGVRLSNLGAQKREVVVTERIPISEVEQVTVEMSAPDAYLMRREDHPGGEEVTQVTARALDERGLVSWSVELPPLGRRAVTLEYRVRSQRGVAGM